MPRTVKPRSCTYPMGIRLAFLTLVGSLLFACIPLRAQTLAPGDPALIRILLFQLDRGNMAGAERFIKENLPQMKGRLEGVLQEIDQEIDIAGRFGAITIHLSPVYKELGEKNLRYLKLFDLYRQLSGDETLFKRFEARRLRAEGAYYTNQGEDACGDDLDWTHAQELYQVAMDRLEYAFALSREVNEPRLMTTTKFNMGSVLIRLLRPAEAIQAYNEGLQYASQLSGDAYTGLLSLNLGNAYIWTAEPARSLEYSQAALAIFKRLNRGTFEANALTNIGNAYLQQQKFDEAWETLHMAVQVAKQSGENRVYGKALLNLGMAGFQLKKKEAAARLEEGVQWYRQDRDIYPAIEREVAVQDGLRMLSEMARRAGDDAAAEKYTKQYLEALGPDPNRYQALRRSPCFEIYKAHPVGPKIASQ